MFKRESLHTVTKRRQKLMKAKPSLFITAVLGLLVFCPAAVADWTEPVPLTEVNSNYYEKSETVASRPGNCLV
jgi:hypothetical protein